MCSVELQASVQQVPEYKSRIQGQLEGSILKNLFMNSSPKFFFSPGEQQQQANLFVFLYGRSLLDFSHSSVMPQGFLDH